MLPWGVIIAFVVAGTLVQFLLLRRRRRRERGRASGGGGLYGGDRDEVLPEQFAENAREARFSREPPAEGHRYCPHCGTENRTDFTYCRNCVNSLTG